MRRFLPLIMAAAFSIVSRAGAGDTPPSAAQVFFDDFHYPDTAALEARGWKVRTVTGWPGVKGATWRRQNVSFPDDPAAGGAGILRMTSTTDGTPAQTYQTQICQQRKFQEGTYAARVHFSRGPSAGPSGDGVVQSFYALSAIEPPKNPNYSECDFEYLPAGGWGHKQPALLVTTWITADPRPDGTNDSVSDAVPGDEAGWHVLVFQVAGGHVRYFLDGRLIGDHSGRCYPREPMTINFNLWFIPEGVGASRQPRSYEEDIDWVYFEKGVALSPGEIEHRVQALRQAGVARHDTVEPMGLPCPCNM